MTIEDHAEMDPFADPNVEGLHQDIGDSTLSVGRNASLTLGTDSLIVLGTLYSHR